MPKSSKQAFGNKADIPAAKAAGDIDQYDVIYMDTGEIGWLDKDKNLVMHTQRSQEAHTLNGTNLGALSDGDTLPENITFDDFLKMVTQKPIPATYTKPSLTLANNGGQVSGDVEAGTSITPKLRAVFTQNDAGALTKITINKNGGAVANSSTSPLSYNGSAFVIGDETVTFVASATYGDAPIKVNNLGKESVENWFAGDTISAAAYAITGKRKLFYGTGAGDLPEVNSANVRALSGTKLAPTQGYSWTIDVAIGQQYIMFAYPADLRDVNQIEYVEANDKGMASSFTKHTINVADARGGSNGLMQYKVFVYRMAVPAAAAMTFKITI